MAQAWQVVPGQDWEGIGRKEKGNGEWEQFLREKIKSWKGGAQSGESARSRWERLLEIGWARRTKVKRDKHRGLKRKLGRVGVGV